MMVSFGVHDMLSRLGAAGYFLSKYDEITFLQPGWPNGEEITYRSLRDLNLTLRSRQTVTQTNGIHRYQLHHSKD
jgi:hypothetical protein